MAKMLDRGQKDLESIWIHKCKEYTEKVSYYEEMINAECGYVCQYRHEKILFFLCYLKTESH